MAENERATPFRVGIVVAILTIGFVAVNARQTLERYREMNLGWSWDLAYYNQWFWALTQGDGKISIRPASAYGNEAESIWRSNYLAPIRLAIAPFYALSPRPETLLLVEAAILGLIVPAAYVLARGESRSPIAALCASGLVVLTPLFLPLAENDFRELQLAIPFAFLAMEGVRGRRLGLAAIGVGGLLACRQEYALMVASLALLPSRTEEDLGSTYRWATRLWLVGFLWMTAFLVYLIFTRNADAPALYLAQFRGRNPGLRESLATAGEFAFVGLAAWSVTAWAVPRAAILVLPWLWSLSSGRWSLRYLGATEWHHVRYASPFVAIGAAAGVLGFARLFRLAGNLRSGKRLPARILLVGATAAGLLLGRSLVADRMATIPRPVSVEEAKSLWPWIDRVGPHEGVIADYAVAAPLSSRPTLRSYIIPSDPPPGYPRLGPEYHSIFARRDSQAPSLFTSQGFEILHQGETIWVYRRPGPGPAPMTRADAHAIASVRWNAVRFLLALMNDDVVIFPGLFGLGFVWYRFRRGWRAASLRPVESTGAEVARRMLAEESEVAVKPVSDPPFDLAVPSRRTLRLSRRTAEDRTDAAASIAAIEAAHMLIALRPGFLGRIARLRPAFLLTLRPASISVGILLFCGALLCNLTIFEYGIVGFFAVVGLALVEFPLELAAVRLVRFSSAETDPRFPFLADVALRRIAEIVPLPWHRR